MTLFLEKPSITLGNKYPFDPYKNQATKSAYGNYFPLDRDLQKTPGNIVLFVGSSLVKLLPLQIQ